MSTYDPVTGEIEEYADKPAVEAVGPRKVFRTSIDAFLRKLSGKRQTVDGAELPSDVPIAPPIGYKKQPTMVEHIRNAVRSEQLRLAAEAAGAESFEEADDFEVEDDLEPISAYEFERFFEPPAESRPAAQADSPKPAEPAPAPASPAPSPAPAAPAPHSA